MNISRYINVKNIIIFIILLGIFIFIIRNMYSEPRKIISNIKTKKFDEVSKKLKELKKKKPKKTEKQKQLELIMERKKKEVMDINTSIDKINNVFSNIQPIPIEITKKIML